MRCRMGSRRARAKRQTRELAIVSAAADRGEFRIIPMRIYENDRAEAVPVSKFRSCPRALSTCNPVRGGAIARAIASAQETHLAIDHASRSPRRWRAGWALVGVLVLGLPAAADEAANRVVPDKHVSRLSGSVVAVSSPPTNAAPAVECPAVGATGVANVLPDWKDGDFPLDADEVATIEKIDAIVGRVRKDQPGVPFPSLVNSLTAAYCPIVAKQPDRTDAQKRAQLVRFDKILEQRIAAASALADDQILAQVPLSESVMRAVTAAAVTAHETPAQWMADVVAKAVVAPK